VQPERFSYAGPVPRRAAYDGRRPKTFTKSRHSAAPAATPAHSPKASLSQCLEGVLSGHLVKRLAVPLR
jgi:hypothetical protein